MSLPCRHFLVSSVHQFRQFHLLVLNNIQLWFICFNRFSFLCTSYLRKSSFYGGGLAVTDDDVFFKWECNGTYTATNRFGVDTNITRQWTTPFYNFNHVGNGFLSLITVALLEGYLWMCVHVLAPKVSELIWRVK